MNATTDYFSRPLLSYVAWRDVADLCSKIWNAKPGDPDLDDQAEQKRKLIYGSGASHAFMHRMHLSGIPTYKPETTKFDYSGWEAFPPEALRISHELLAYFCTTELEPLHQTTEWKEASRLDQSALDLAHLAKAPVPSPYPSDRVKGQTAIQLTGLLLPALLATVGFVAIHLKVPAAYQLSANLALGVSAFIGSHAILKALQHKRAKLRKRITDQFVNAPEYKPAHCLIHFFEQCKDVRLDQTTKSFFLASEHPNREGLRIDENLPGLRSLFPQLHNYALSVFISWVDDNTKASITCFYELARREQEARCLVEQERAQREAAAKAEQASREAAERTRREAKERYREARDHYHEISQAAGVGYAAACVQADDDLYPNGRINPATGLPMLGEVDSAGNPFGSDITQYPMGHVNPSSGLPMMPNVPMDVGGNVFGSGSPW